MYNDKKLSYQKKATEIADEIIKYVANEKNKEQQYTD